MKIDEVLKVLDESNGAYAIPVYIPSLKREVSFNPFTIGKIKTISKLLISGDDDDDLFIVLVSTILDLCRDQNALNLNELTEMDLTYILMILKIQNGLKDDVFKIECSEKDCDYTFNYNVDFGTIVDKFKKVIDNTTKDFKKGAMDISVEFGMPSLELIIKYKGFIEMTKKSLKEKTEDFSDEDLLKIEYYMIKYSNLLFIKNITINGELVDNFDKASIKQRNDIIDKLPPNIINYIQDEIISTNKFDVPKLIDNTIKCNKCESDIHISMDYQDFFLT